MTTGKTVVLTMQTFVSIVMSLLFNTLSRFVIAFLSRSKCLLISSLQSPSAVILEPRKIKSVTVSTFPLSICHEVMGPDAMILVFLMLHFKLAFSLSSFYRWTVVELFPIGVPITTSIYSPRSPTTSSMSLECHRLHFKLTYSTDISIKNKFKK